MKTCSQCQSTAFDDMAVCYGCLQPFNDVMSKPAVFPPRLEDEDLPVEEPTERGQVLVRSTHPRRLVERPTERGQGVRGVLSPVRLHVAIPDLFGYDIYLCREEGAQLTIGCARDNNIVLPHTESKRHLLRLYYMRGQVWVEDISPTQQALVDSVPLTGTRCLKPGAVLKIGEATIEIVEE